MSMHCCVNWLDSTLEYNGCPYIHGQKLCMFMCSIHRITPPTEAFTRDILLNTTSDDFMNLFISKMHFFYLKLRLTKGRDKKTQRLSLFWFTPLVDTMVKSKPIKPRSQGLLLSLLCGSKAPRT